MSLLELTPPEKAEGKLAELYAEAKAFFGSVPNNVRLYGVSPALLENQFQLIGHFAGHPTLSAQLLAMIRMLVASSTESSYCEGFNSGMLQQQKWFSAEQIEAAKKDPANAPLADKEKSLLLFVLKGAKDPHSVTADDIKALKDIGWSEADIFDALAHGSRATATNILFDAFKVQLDGC